MIATHAHNPDRAPASRPDNVVALTARATMSRGGRGNEGSREDTSGTHGEERSAHGLLTLSIEHSIPQVGHYTRLLSASTAMSVAELVEAILVAYRWPTIPEYWTLRVKNRGLVTMYAPGKLGATEHMLGVRSAGKSVGETLSKGCVAQLQVGEMAFIMHATDVVTHQDADPAAVLLGAEFLPAADQFGRPLTEADALHPLGIPTAVSLSEINIELAGEAFDFGAQRGADVFGRLGDGGGVGQAQLDGERAAASGQGDVHGRVRISMSVSMRTSTTADQ